MSTTGNGGHGADFGPDRSLSLTPQDRCDIAECTEYLQTLCCDRLIIHDVSLAEGHSAAQIVCAHRPGQAWARWVFARTGARVSAWSGLTAKDIRSFPRMSDAIRSVLLGDSHGDGPVEGN